MAVTFSEIPEIARTEVGDFGRSLGVDHRDLTMAIDDVSPLRRVVPMHLTGTSGIHKQMRARDIAGDRKDAHGNLSSPPTGGRLDGPLIEGSREDDGITSLAWNCLEVFLRSGDIVSRRVPIAASCK
jgi:hypothetical protein